MISHHTSYKTKGNIKGEKTHKEHNVGRNHAYSLPPKHHLTKLPLHRPIGFR